MFTGISGDYSLISSNITPVDGVIFLAIVSAINQFIQTIKIPTSNGFELKTPSLLDLASQDIRINMGNLTNSQNWFFNIGSLKASGLIQTNDNIHIGISLLGFGFYQYVMENQ